MCKGMEMAFSCNIEKAYLCMDILGSKGMDKLKINFRTFASKGSRPNSIPGHEKNWERIK